MKHSPGFLRLVSDAKKRIPEVSVTKLKGKLKSGDDLHVVDVREEHEWNAGHVAGAIHIGKGIIERDIEKTIPDKNAEIVLYCGGGFRSALAADNLRKMGYRHVHSLAGGWRAWKRARGKVQK